jgi:hypothetical protein
MCQSVVAAMGGIRGSPTTLHSTAPNDPQSATPLIGAAISATRQTERRTMTVCSTRILLGFVGCASTEAK